MTNIVLNEKACAEHAIANLTLGSKPIETLGRVARYYYSEGYKKREIGSLLEDFMLKCDPTINIVKWQATIDRQVNSADKYELIDIPGVAVTKSEMEQIKKIEGKLLQRLMFTMLCLAKYGNAINPNNNSWVNRKDKEIFSLANITITTKRQSLMINDLWTLGYIGYRGFLKVWKTIEDYIADSIKDESVKKIVIVGYSHGAAIAALCHEYVWYNRPDLRDALEGYGFGCPRVFWGFRTKKLRQRWERFKVIRNLNDIVTHVPPAIFGFSHIGKMIEIGERGKYNMIDAHRPENILAELHNYETMLK